MASPRAGLNVVEIKPEYITLKVVDQEQRLIHHTLKKTDKLQALMDKYYREEPDVTYGTGTFWFEAACLRGCRTPADLELEDGDLIDFFQEQTGGGLDAGSMAE